MSLVNMNSFTINLYSESKRGSGCHLSFLILENSAFLYLYSQNIFDNLSKFCWMFLKVNTFVLNFV
jgi:hypothetical protein